MIKRRKGEMMLGVIALAAVVTFVILLLWRPKNPRPKDGLTKKDEQLVRNAERALYWSNHRRGGR